MYDFKFYSKTLDSYAFKSIEENIIISDLFCFTCDETGPSTTPSNIYVDHERALTLIINSKECIIRGHSDEDHTLAFQNLEEICKESLKRIKYGIIIFYNEGQTFNNYIMDCGVISRLGSTHLDLDAALAELVIKEAASLQFNPMENLNAVNKDSSNDNKS